MDLVLRHFRNITALAGDSLDRWNSVFPIPQTFAAVYAHIHDNWRDVTPAGRDALRAASIVPVGACLVRPSRVFFRLAEDLSPFMHELPRAFGAHESFLKEVGVCVCVCVSVCVGVSIYCACLILSCLILLTSPYLLLYSHCILHIYRWVCASVPVRATTSPFSRSWPPSVRERASTRTSSRPSSPSYR
jgi:hypothetical protein